MADQHDHVQAFIDRRNSERAGRHNPLFRPGPRPRPLPAELASDPVAAFILKMNERAAPLADEPI